MEHIKSIIFVITDLETGGAEKTLVSIVNYLSSHYKISILTLYRDWTLAPLIQGDVKVLSILDQKNNYRGVKRFIPRLALLFPNLFLKKNKLENSFDYVVSFLEGPPTILANRLPGKKRIAWVHTTITKHVTSRLKLYQLQSEYKKYNKIAFVSKLVQEDFNSRFKTHAQQYVIENFQDIEQITKLSKEKCDFNKTRFTFVVVSRLQKVKAIDRLINVHKKLIDLGFMHDIIVVGDGPERLSLQQQVNSLSLMDTFHFLGEKLNPYPYIALSDCLLLLSHYEGLGNVVAEAMILNKLVLVTKTGSAELVEKYGGIIVENDEDSIFNEMKEILIDLKTTLHYNYDNATNTKLLEEVFDD